MEEQETRRQNPDGPDGNVHIGHRERKRRQFRLYGADSFADHELLELLLFYGIPRMDTNGIAHRLLEQFGSLQRVLDAPLKELERVEGVGKTSALLVAMVAPLYRRALLSEQENVVVLDTVEQLGEYFLKLYIAENLEVMYELCLDAKGRLLNRYRLSSGTPVSVGLDIREIISNALSSSAAMVVLAHNHPSGVAIPSPADLAGTEQVRNALDVINILLADHIIVADNDYISFRESGYL